MTESVRLLSRRNIPASGSDVHAYDYGTFAHVVLFTDRLIVAQQIFESWDEAHPYARILADSHGCALIEHDCRQDRENDGE